MRGVSRKCTVRLSAAVCCLALLLSLPPEASEDLRGADEGLAPAELPLNDSFESMPADYFIENKGQLANQEVSFYTASGDMQAGFAESAMLIKMNERQPVAAARRPVDHDLTRSALLEPASAREVLVRLNFEGANKVTPRGRDPLPQAMNFFIGNDPARWQTGVRSYREIVYEDLYDGTDLVYRLGQQGLKYDFIVSPGADPSLIRMAYEGGESLDVNTESLVLHTAAGEIRDDGLVATAGGDSVKCEFARVGILVAGFYCGRWDHSRTLVIDPLVWAMYLGGSDDDYAIAVALDASGNALVAGDTYSTDFPATPGAYDLTFGNTDAFVAKLSEDGSFLLWATYLGGSTDDGVWAIALDALGNVIVTGHTWSADFPSTPGAYDAVHNGGVDVFVATLSADGSSLLWSTFLGGSEREWPSAHALDAFGNIVVAGYTYSTDFPTTPGAYDITYNGGLVDTFAAKLSANGSTLLWATFLGGTGPDWANALVLDGLGNPVMAGETFSTDLPVTVGAFDVTKAGSWDGFVAKLNSNGSSLLWATYLGAGDTDSIGVLAIDTSGNPIAAGSTYSADFPVTPGAYDVTFNGAYDTFVARLSEDGSSLLWSTFLGGRFLDRPQALTLDRSGNIIVAGITNSTDFPVTPDAYDATLDGLADSFVARLNADGSSLLWATYFGGSENDWVDDFRFSASGSLIIAGGTNSTDFPTTTGAYDVTHNGADDAFVAELELPNIPPTITITSPSGGEVWTQGSSKTVAWTAFDSENQPSALRVWINYTSSAGSGNICGPVAGNVGTCPWTLPTIIATDVVVNATVIDTGGLKGHDDSDPFTIQAPPNTPPTITITTPSGGEVWIQGSTPPVAWILSDGQDAPAFLVVWINYTSSAGSGTMLGPVPGDTPPFNWLVPSITVTDMVVNGTVIDTGGLKGYDESGQLTIRAPLNTPPTINVTYPRGGEVLLKGSSQIITWTMHDSQDVGANLTIYINYTAGGVTNQLAVALKGQLSFAWTLPDIGANDVVVNITVIDTGGLRGWSQSGPFTIKAPPPQSQQPDLPSQYWWLVLAIVVAVVFALLLFALASRKKPEEGTPPPQRQTPPPNG